MTPLSQNTKEFHDQTLGLRIIEDGWIIIRIEDELEIRIVDDLLNLANVQVIVNIFQFEAQLEVLIIEDANLCLRVIFENLYNSCRVD